MDNTALIYAQYRKMSEGRAFFHEYCNMVKLVDDLDTRFWKRFVLRDYRRKDSIDNDLAEDNLRKAYRDCVSDLVAFRAEVEEALATVKTAHYEDLIREHYIHGLSEEEIAEKWALDDVDVSSDICKGLAEMDVPESFLERMGKSKKGKKNRTVCRFENKK